MPQNDPDQVPVLKTSALSRYLATSKYLNPNLSSSSSTTSSLIRTAPSSSSTDTNPISTHSGTHTTPQVLQTATPVQPDQPSIHLPTLHKRPSTNSLASSSKSIRRTSTSARLLGFFSDLLSGRTEDDGEGPEDVQSENVEPDVAGDACDSGVTEPGEPSEMANEVVSTNETTGANIDHAIVPRRQNTKTKSVTFLLASQMTFS
jgi:hypothetical protein